MIGVVDRPSLAQSMTSFGGDQIKFDVMITKLVVMTMFGGGSQAKRASAVKSCMHLSLQSN